MSNILPVERKAVVWRMYRARFILAGSFVILCCACIAILAMAPSYFVLVDAAAGVGPQSGQNPSTDADRAAVVHTQGLVNALSPLTGTTSASALIAAALSERPLGITISHVTATTGDPGTVILTGTAATVDAVNQYQRALRTDGRFPGVSVPLGDLAGTENGTFSITISADF